MTGYGTLLETEVEFTVLFYFLKEVVLWNDHTLETSYLKVASKEVTSAGTTVNVGGIFFIRWSHLGSNLLSDQI